MIPHHSYGDRVSGPQNIVGLPTDRRLSDDWQLPALSRCAGASGTKSPQRQLHKKINFSQVFAGQAVGIKEIHHDIWLVSFMDYDLGYFDLETRVLEPLENPFGPKVSPM